MKLERIPHDNLYEIFLTLILAFVLVIFVYALTPNKKYDLYFCQPKSN